MLLRAQQIFALGLCYPLAGFKRSFWGQNHGGGKEETWSLEAIWVQRSGAREGELSRMGGRAGGKNLGGIYLKSELGGVHFPNHH